MTEDEIAELTKANVGIQVNIDGTVRMHIDAYGKQLGVTMTLKELDQVIAQLAEARTHLAGVTSPKN